MTRSILLAALLALALTACGKNLLGNYRCIKSFLGSELDKNKIVDNKNIFDLYVFNRKL